LVFISYSHADEPPRTRLHILSKPEGAARPAEDVERSLHPGRRRVAARD
jgi:hypothetical protein